MDVKSCDGGEIYRGVGGCPRTAIARQLHWRMGDAVLLTLCTLHAQWIAYIMEHINSIAPYDLFIPRPLGTCVTICRVFISYFCTLSPLGDFGDASQPFGVLRLLHLRRRGQNIFRCSGLYIAIRAVCEQVYVLKPFPLIVFYLAFLKLFFTESSSKFSVNFPWSV